MTIRCSDATIVHFTGKQLQSKMYISEISLEELLHHSGEIRKTLVHHYKLQKTRIFSMPANIDNVTQHELINKAINEILELHKEISDDPSKADHIWDAEFFLEEHSIPNTDY